MPRDSSLLLKDIATAVSRTQEYLAGHSFESFCQNQMAVDAVIRNLEIIGEAAKNLSDSVRDRVPEIPWVQIAGLRDVLIHAYHRVDLSLVWSTVTSALPALERNLAPLIDMYPLDTKMNPSLCQQDGTGMTPISRRRADGQNDRIEFECPKCGARSETVMPSKQAAFWLSERTDDKG